MCGTGAASSAPSVCFFISELFLLLYLMFFFFTRLHVQTMIIAIRSKRPPHWHPYPNDDEQGLETQMCLESLVLFFNSSHISMAVGGRQWDLKDGAQVIIWNSSPICNHKSI